MLINMLVINRSNYTMRIKVRPRSGRLVIVGWIRPSLHCSYVTHLNSYHNGRAIRMITVMLLSPVMMHPPMKFMLHMLMMSMLTIIILMIILMMIMIITMISMPVHVMHGSTLVYIYIYILYNIYIYIYSYFFHIFFCGAHGGPMGAASIPRKKKTL